MSSIDVFLMAIRNLFKRKVRTSLTLLGVAIGTASIVVMISLGYASNLNFEAQLHHFGEVLNINVHNWRMGGEPMRVVLNNDMIDYINSWDDVEAASPQLRMGWGLEARIGRRTAWLQVTGVRPDAMSIFGLEAEHGRLLAAGDTGYQIVFGSEVLFDFMTPQEREAQQREWMNQWGGGRGGMVVWTPPWEDEGREPPRALEDALNGEVLASFVPGALEPPAITGEFDPNRPVININRIRPYEFQTVGVLAPGGRGGGFWESYMNIETVMRMTNEMEQWQRSQGQQNVEITDFEREGFDNAIVRARDIHVAEDVVNRLEEMGFSNVWSPMPMINAQRAQAQDLQNMLAVIGAVSMFVAFIGIANTMIMSIYERTKEIGVMKVIGASLGDIGKLFLTEAALIGLIGGVIGLGVSYGLSYALNTMELPFLQVFGNFGFGDDESITSYIPTWLYGVALGFSAVVGLLAGFLPAVRAMRISALTAIRTE